MKIYYITAFVTTRYGTNEQEILGFYGSETAAEKKLEQFRRESVDIYDRVELRTGRVE